MRLSDTSQSSVIEWVKLKKFTCDFLGILIISKNQKGMYDNFLLILYMIIPLKFGQVSGLESLR